MPKPESGRVLRCAFKFGSQFGHNGLQAGIYLFDSDAFVAVVGPAREGFQQGIGEGALAQMGKL